MRAGQLIGLPTETVYGLGADAMNPDAVRGIFAAKGRPPTHPLIVHVASAKALPRWAADIPAAARALAARFWPGPLTLVLPRAAGVPLVVTGGQETVALRVPAHPLALAVLSAFGGGVAAPSANRYGRISPTTADHVREEMGSAVAIVLDGGPCEVGLESTIVACLDGRVTLLRPGRLTQRELEDVVGALHAPVAAPRVPGSARAHYAPLTPLAIVAAGDLEATRAAHAAAGRRTAVLALRPAPGDVPPAEWVSLPVNAAQYAHDLYATLRTLDGLGAHIVLVERPPDGDTWTAVHDRLARAAAGHAPDATLREAPAPAPP